MYERTLDRPSVGGDALIAPPRPQARKTPPPSVREVSRLRRDGGRDGRGRTPPLRTSTERAPRSIPVIPRSEATWESVLLFASGGLFSFSSERKEEKKRRQKLRFWISLRGFTYSLSRWNKPRERCAVQISPKCCIVSASRSAAAFALKCKAAQFYVSTRKHLQKRRPKAATYLCRKAAKARFDNRHPTG